MSDAKASVTNSVNELMKIVTDGYFQIACTRLYEMTHTTDSEKSVQDTIDHPNMWFELSYGKGEKYSKNVSSEPEKVLSFQFVSL